MWGKQNQTFRSEKAKVSSHMSHSSYMSCGSHTSYAQNSQGVGSVGHQGIGRCPAPKASSHGLFGKCRMCGTQFQRALKKARCGTSYRMSYSVPTNANPPKQDRGLLRNSGIEVSKSLVLALGMVNVPNAEFRIDRLLEDIAPGGWR